jgi:hypothetical protein
MPAPRRVPTGPRGLPSRLARFRRGTRQAEGHDPRNIRFEIKRSLDECQRLPMNTHAGPRRPSSRRSQPAMWFQLANIRLTT